MKYPPVQDGEWVAPIRKGYRIACCDCGLIHVMDFKLIGGKRKRIIFRARRSARSTAQYRRAQGIRVTIK